MTMTKEKAIQILSTRDAHGVLCGYTSGVTEALDMAIDALQFVEHFDLLKEFQSLQEVVRCKDCVHFTGLNESKTWGRCNAHGRTVQDIDYCSWGERKGGDTK